MSDLIQKKLAGATLPALQQVFDSGSASEKASFQASVSAHVRRTYELSATNSGSVNHAALQLAIDSVAGTGDDLQLPPGVFSISENLVFPADTSVAGRLKYRWWGSSGTRLNLADGKSIVMSGHRTTIANIILGASSTSQAPLLRFASGGTRAGAVKNVGFDGGAVEQLDTTNSIAGVFEDLILVNGLQSRNSFTGYRGALLAGGTDGYFSRIEANATSGFTNISATAYAAAIAVSGVNHFFSSCIGELSDCGFVFLPSSSKNRGALLRADLNFGHGVVLAGGGADIAVLSCVNNGRAAAGLYSGLKSTGAQFVGSITGLGVDNAISNTLVSGVDVSTITGAGSSLRIDVSHIINATSDVITNDFLPAEVNLPSGFTRLTLASGATSIPAGPTQNIVLIASTAVSISSIQGGFYGQQVTLISESANVTIVHGGGTGGIYLRSAANYVFPGSGATVRLMYMPRGGSGGRWVQI